MSVKYFETQLAEALADAAGLQSGDLLDMLETPKDPTMGDLALPCFKLSKTLKKAPPAIAAQLAQSALPSFVREARVAGGYLNFSLNPAALAEYVLGEIKAQGAAYGGSDQGAGKTVCIDYSSINIAKPFHVGHLMSTAIGNALYRIYNFLGYTSVGINHLGDWGTQFGKLIVAYKTWGDREAVERLGVAELTRLYVHYHDQAEKNPALDDEARSWFLRIEQGDQEALELFEWFKAITMREVQEVYELLDVTFDSYAGESFYNDKMQPVIDLLREKNLLVEDKGALVVDLSAYDMPPCLLVKSDGATLYATRDIAAAFYRKHTYNFAKALYVVAYQQNLHFKQWFKVVELLGCDWAKDLEHVAFGMVSLEDGTLSTRKGKVVLLLDVLKKAIQKTQEIMAEKSPHLTGEALFTVSRQVGVGAVVFQALYAARIKDMQFSYDRVLNFDGETGPYVQYTHARCCSVLKKADQSATSGCPVDGRALADAESYAVVKALYAFPEAVQDAMRRNEPCCVARQLVALAQAYNKFYFEHRILTEDAVHTAARLALTAATKQVLKTGLSLLGIQAPEQM